MTKDNTFAQGMHRLRQAMERAVETAARQTPGDQSDVNVVVARNIRRSRAGTTASATQDVTIRQDGDTPDEKSGER